MKRRVCESCVYFESAGFAKNGWCHHPSRRQNSDVRLMVRSNELGCRNGWNADLWVPANVEGTAQRDQPLARIGGRASAEVEHAEQSDLITSIVAAKTDNPALPDQRAPAPARAMRPLVEEDIIVNQKPSLSWSTPSAGPISTQPATELVQNPKAAILRARDQFRQRRRGEGRLADQRLADPGSTYLASAREAQQVHDHDLAPPEPDPNSIDPRFENRPLIRTQPVSYSDSQRPVSPVSLREVDRPFPSLTDFPEDRARFESVPYADSSDGIDELIDVAQHDTWIETRQIDAMLPEPYEVDELFEEDDPAVYAGAEQFEDEEFSVQHRESILNRYLRQRRERRQSPDGHAAPYETQVAATTHQPSRAIVEIQEAPEYDSGTNDRLEAFDARENGLCDSIDDSYESLPAIAYDDVERIAEPVAHRATTRPEIRPEQRHVQNAKIPPAYVEDDDFVIPPPLPEYRPSDEQQTQVFDTRPRPRAEPPQERQRPASPAYERPIADEFGDQPLFASQPVPVVDDVEIDAPYGRSDQRSYVSPRMERICQTCRDFRPAENGERGWCNNKWAFNHRRMVDADDLACQNSLGSWWTPKDDSWRRDGDISRHAQQTPRVDQWLMGNPQNESDRRRSGS